MANSSLAAQAVAHGPLTAAPPSFDGHGWLVVLNLALMTTAALVAAMVVGKVLRELWFGRDGSQGPLVATLRWIVAIAFFGMLLRTGVEAVTLWGWDPFDPAQTGWYLTLKRLVDPFGAACYLLAMCGFILTEDALTASLGKKPFPERLVKALPKLKRPAILAGLSVLAAIGVVSLR